MDKKFKKFLIFPVGSERVKGQTLIETLSALAIISIVITAIGITVTAALSNAKYNQYVTQATKYAQQGSEIVTQIRDDNYNSFAGYTGTYCLAKNQTTLGARQTNCTSPNFDNFIRSVVITQGGCGANVAQVVVTVKFSDSKCSGANLYCHKQVVTSCLSTVNPVQAP